MVLGGIPLSWLASYLRNSQQYVSISGHSSSEREIDIGVPPGSILEPQLFLVYINDLPNVSNVFSSLLYADDTTFLASDSNTTNMFNSLNRELPQILNWTIANRLSLNLEKTYAMIFSNRINNGNQIQEVHLNNASLKFKTNEKFLGYILDNELKFHGHIKIISRKLSRTVGIMYKLKECAT